MLCVEPVALVILKDSVRRDIRLEVSVTTGIKIGFEDWPPNEKLMKLINQTSVCNKNWQRIA